MAFWLLVKLKNKTMIKIAKMLRGLNTVGSPFLIYMDLACVIAS